MGAEAKLILILQRLMQAVPALIGIIIVTFLLTHALPGDPAAYFAGPAATPDTIAEIRHNLGLDRSLPVQFLVYVENLVHGDFGQSISTGQSVGHELMTRLPASLELTLLALLVSTAIAVPLGILAATRPDSWIDHLCRFIVTAGVSLPTFFTGLALVYVFYYELGWAPAPLGRLDVLYSPPDQVTGFYTIDALLMGDLDTFRAALAQLVLPAATLALFTLAPIARMTRGAMLQVLGGEFVRTARAAGLRGSTVLFTYAFRNAVLPVITTLGMVFSFALGANVLVEKVFSWPGIGSFAISALVVSDYAAVQGFVLLMAVLFVLLNLTIDVIYLLIDPRVGIES
jgi:peptide/nickel transport system permease protein